LRSRPASVRSLQEWQQDIFAGSEAEA